MKIQTIASGSKGNAHLISDGKTTLLLDAGVAFREIQAACNYDTGKIAAALVTHRHGDHSKAIPQLVKRGIKVYSTADVMNRYGGTIPAQEKKPVEIEGVIATPFIVPHDVSCFGWQIDSTETKERLLYIVDAEYVKYRFKDVTHLMIEANHSRELITERAKDGKLPVKLAERIIKTHMSIETALGFIRANDMSRIKQIYLLHLSDDNSNAEKFKRLVQEETGAEVYVP